MIQGIEPLFQQVADGINASIRERWNSATLEAVFHPDRFTLLGSYLTELGATPKSFRAPRRTEKSFHRMRALFVQAGKPLWCKARFKLHSDGEFNIDWIYDECDENGFTKGG